MIYIFLMILLYVLIFFICRKKVAGAKYKKIDQIILLLSFLCLLIGVATPLSVFYFYLLSVFVLFIWYLIKVIFSAKLCN